MKNQVEEKFFGYWESVNLPPNSFDNKIIKFEINENQSWSKLSVTVNKKIETFYALKYIDVFEDNENRTTKLHFRVYNSGELPEQIEEVILECKAFMNHPIQMVCKLNFETFYRLYAKKE